MILNFINRLVVAALLSSVGFVWAGNLEADSVQGGSRSSAVRANGKPILLVKRDNDGIRQYYQVDPSVTPDKLPGLIETLQKKGSVKGVVKLTAKQVTRKNPTVANAEADNAMAKQSWHYFYGGLRFGYYPGAHYYNGYWPANYWGYGCFNNNFCNVNPWASYNYAWSYGCGGYTYGIYF